MAELQTTKLQEFKDKIGFDSVPKSINPSAGVVAHWPDPRTSPALQGEAWTVAGDTTWAADGGAARKWFLRSGDQTIMLTVFVSSTGSDPARSFFLTTASDNMMVSVPYEKSDPQLGSLSVCSSQADEWIWFYENTCFQVRGIEAQADLLQLCRWLQKFAEDHLEPELSRHHPPVEAVQTSARDLRVGESLSLDVTLRAEADSDRYLFEVQQQGDHLEIDEQEAFKAQVTATSVGQGKIYVQVIDSVTLLSVSSVVELWVRVDK